MNCPMFYTASGFANVVANGPQAGLPDGRYVPSRPLGWQGLSLRTRLRAAWLVFTGRADVLQWEGQP